MIVRALPERAKGELGPLYAALDEAMHGLVDNYSDEEVAIILDFMRRTSALMLEQIARVRGEAGEDRE